MTIKELAKELNLSITTVSRVLNGQEEKYRISVKTAEKVLEAAAKHQFAPNMVARNLRLQRTNTIGLIIPDISNPFFANLARSVESELRAMDKMILLCDTRGETAIEEESVNLLLGRQVDGLLVAPAGEKWEHLLKNKTVPLVLLDRFFPEVELPYAVADNYRGAYEATLYLLGRGHRNIACIQGQLGTSTNARRVLGYQEAMRTQGQAEAFSKVVGADYSIENGYQSTLQLLQKAERPTAIFAMNNQIAVGALKAIMEAGLRIPEDVSLLAFDEQPHFELLSPPLTAVKQPMYEIGKAAVEILTGLLAGQAVSNSVLPPTLIERASVRSISVS